VFNFIFNALKFYFLLCVGGCGGRVGDFYPGIVWNDFVVEALAVGIVVGIAGCDLFSNSYMRRWKQLDVR
jgi:hypothetical protein